MDGKGVVPCKQLPLCQAPFACAQRCVNEAENRVCWGQSCCVERPFFMLLQGPFSCFFRLQLPQLKSGFGWGSFLEYQNLDKDGLDEGHTNSDWLSAIGPIGAGWRKHTEAFTHTQTHMRVYTYIWYLFDLYAIAVYYCHIIMLHYHICTCAQRKHAIFNIFSCLVCMRVVIRLQIYVVLGAFAYHDPIF